MIRIDTLGALIDYRYSLSIHCHAWDCWNSAPIDLAALAHRLGRDHGCLATDLKQHFRCSICGSKDVGFVLSPPATCSAVAEKRRVDRMR